MPRAAVVQHRDLIVTLAARAAGTLPAGGLMFYRPDLIEAFRQAAGYVDRILKARSLPTYRFRPQPNSN
jgi:hypothetical protein